MRRAQRLLRLGRSGGQLTLVGVMCGLVAVPPGMGAQPTAGARLPVERHAKPLSEQEKVLQALNRFTFGPRPGDVAAVEAMGLQRWFEMELHPDKIDDSVLEAEMAEFPAMRLTADQLKERFPSGQVIRQMGKQGGSLPNDPVEKAIYADAEAVYAARVEKDKAAVGTIVGRGSVVGPTHDDNAVMNEVAAMTISPVEVETVLTLAPGERFGRLVGMAPGEMLGFRDAVKGKDRVRLVAGMSPSQREAVEAMVESPERVVANEDQETRLMRDVDSKRQLQAVMTEFWLNHFNVYLHKSEEEPYLLPEYAQDAIEMQSSSLKRWIDPDGSFNDDLKFMQLLLENWLRAYRLVPGTQDPRPAIAVGLQRLHDLSRDSLGHFGNKCNYTPKAGPYTPFKLIDQAAAAQAFLAAAAEK